MQIKKELKKAHAAYQLNDINLCVNILIKILQKYPENFEANLNLANIGISRGDYGFAEKFIEKAEKIKADDHIALNLIACKINLSKIDDAELYIKKYYLKLKKNINYIYLTAKIKIIRKEYNEAEKILDNLLRNNEKNIQAMFSLAYIHNVNNRYENAINLYNKILNIENNNYDALVNYGIINIKNYINVQSGVISLEKAFKQNSTQNVEIRLTLAAGYEILNKTDEAKKIIDELYKKNPNNYLVNYQMASFLSHLDRDKEALVFINRSIEINDNFPLAKYTKGIILIKLGDYKLGFDFYSYRQYQENLMRNLNKDFDVKLLKAKDNIVIYAEQGIGDTILYLRLVDEVKKLVNKVLLVLPEKLLEIAKRSFNGINIISENISNYEAIIRDYNKAIHIASIPRFIEDFRLIKNKILKINQSLNKQFIPLKTKYNKKIIGISWKSENKKIGNKKSINLEKIIKVFKDEFIYLNLQYGDCDEEIKGLEKKYNVEIINDHNIDLYKDLDGQMALINNCDLVLTISNVTAHLAGSMGKKTILMLAKYIGDIYYWNLLDKENNSIIYPSIKIIKQTFPDDWDQVLSSAKEQIKKSKI